MGPDSPVASAGEKVASLESIQFTGQPKCLNKACELEPHQLDSLKWMASLHENNLNGILADDMVSWLLEITPFKFRAWARQSKPFHSWLILEKA